VSKLPATGKSFWQKPEGKTGQLVIGGIAFSGGVVLYMALPLLIVFFSNIIYAGVLGGIIFAGGAFLCNSRIRHLTRAAFQGLCKKITSIFIDIDPLTILSTYIIKIKSDTKLLAEQIADIGGHIINLDRVVKENTLKIQTNNKTVIAAKRVGENSIAEKKIRSSNRFQKSNDKLIPLRDKLRTMQAVLKKMLANSKFLAEDLEEEITIVTRDARAIKATEGAFKTATKILSGDSVGRSMYDETMDSMVNDYGMAMGRLDQLMETSQDYLKSLDFESGTANEDSFNLFKQLEASDDLTNVKSVKLNSLTN
jgi:phage shock protein A